MKYGEFYSFGRLDVPLTYLIQQYQIFQPRSHGGAQEKEGQT